MRSLFRPTVLMALALMAVILMMILPMPSWVLDMGLAVSFALAILIFTTTLFIERPLDFSSFPTILLASLMLRLSLNVSSTKLIIGEGHTGTDAAGHVIEGFANFVMGGSIALGLVVFGVLLIVNFVVITKGATRMAEVGARFALDGMPGKQLAIDSDVAAGAIDHEEAKRRRETELAETTFFGSLDGASKFVKGDAIAGLLITLLNLVVGLSAGMLIHGMPLGQAVEVYAILTVGDGLVSQIPAVIISIASGLLLARGGGTGAIDAAIAAQIFRHPAALAAVALIMTVFAFVPGLPFAPFMLGALVLAGLALWRLRADRPAPAEEGEPPAHPPDKAIGDILDLDEIRVEFALDLVDLALDPSNGLERRISGLRNHIAERYGIILPEIRMTDEAGLPSGTYVIRIHGVEMARDRLERGHVLVLTGDGAPPALPGRDVKEPVYGAPARWVPADQADAMAGHTNVTPTEVLATHLLEIIKSNFPALLGLKELQKLLDAYARVSSEEKALANRRLLEELIPGKVSHDTLLAVLRHLLAERVSVRNLPVILETIAARRDMDATPEDTAEHVRHRLADQITAELKRPDGTVPLLQLAPDWEDAFARHQVDGGAGGRDIALPPELFQRLAANMADGIGRAAEQGTNAAIVTTARRRRFVQAVLQTRGLPNPVISYEEIGSVALPSIVGSVAA
ncbi:flagellar biosynthesis protein FlhA [Jannaschia seohaensis]|uniref:Flagellar biosynthesis protein FlhA n=1 Tax=Jannaschia seohaensis TaxID=475081 RepID=A0A2Y9AVW1_9RHOB|nr:flagellar biosynthesis protein FlhA [Jannaschia seohaensis]PWJ17415.1 flagellar biosynthesis protein FlhA [Jannaschia seohaensis]SSA47478.1 flagellar biosynthesis protein FlhA [Jannaschia seohaensis]